MSKKIAYMGTGGFFSKIVLNELIKNNVKIDFVIINIKKGSELIPLSYELCKENNIDYIITDDINSRNIKNILEDSKLDLVCVCSLHQIIKPEIFNTPKDGMINLHPSYLPYYQGPNPWFWMIKNGEDEFGASVHLITENIDKGTIISRQKVNLKNCVDGKTIFNRISKLGSEMLVDILKHYINYGFIKINSNISKKELEKGFYNPRPTFEDFRLNIEDEKPNKNYKLINRIINWGVPWFIFDRKTIYVKRAIEFNENSSYNLKIIQNDSHIKIYNKHGILHLKII